MKWRAPARKGRHTSPTPRGRRTRFTASLPAAGVKSDGHRRFKTPARAIPLQRAPSFSLPRHLPCRRPRSKHSTPSRTSR
ncbi:hypothetical protein HMPREF0262_02415 [Clostridium sp. ATCC 29733]|nr:hypothetical protein HMPREF0262_02415 [Clostridium sp. ATCC 29733]